MAKPKQPKVVWYPGQDKPMVDPNPIQATKEGDSIHWSVGLNVRRFRIWGLDPMQFQPTHSPQPPSQEPKLVKHFTTKDVNTLAGTQSYWVEAENKDGRIASHDPRIENGGGGGPVESATGRRSAAARRR